MSIEPVRAETVSAEPVVWASDLSVQYRSRNATSYNRAVDGVTFTIGAGEVLGLVGESGSGKSTLAMAIAGLSGRGRVDDGVPEICGGSLKVFGTEMRDIGQRAHDKLTLRIGYLAQDGALALNPRLTVGENIAEPLYERDRRFKTREASAIVATLVDSVQLPLGMISKYPFELSSGQRQRVALARALVLEPQLLVADEPTRGVDATVRSGVLAVLRQLQEERGFAALVISSDIAVVESMTDTVAILGGGVVIGLGALSSLLARPSHPYLKALANVRAAYLGLERAGK